MSLPREEFLFRPWVRRSGLSIVLVAAAVSVMMAATLTLSRSSRHGWLAEPFAWIYIGALWAGGLKVYLGTKRPIAEIDEELIVVRPLHQFRRTSVRWSQVLGIEQMIGGDRMILYFEGNRGMRYVALNLNLVKRRKEFVTRIERLLEKRGFLEKTLGRSRYLSREQNESRQ